METHTAARQMQDVNASGSLRFRSLWLYGATHAAPAEDWRPMWGQIDDIRRRLRPTYPEAVRGTDASWNAASGQLARTGRVDWPAANALRVSANTMTLSIEHRAQREAARAGLLMTLGMVGMALMMGKSLRLARRTEQAEAEAVRLAAILEATPDFVGMADAQGRITYLNRAFHIMAGLAPGALRRGLHIKDCHPQATARTLHEQAFPIVREQGVWTGESALLDRDGRAVPVSQTIVAHRNADGEIERFSTIARDITAARQAEHDLRQAEQEYHAIYENATEGILQATPPGRIRRANPALARMLGYDSPAQFIAEITDIGQQMYAHPEDRQRLLAQIRQHGRAEAFEAPLRRRDGGTVWVSMNVRNVPNKDGEMLYLEGTLEDITERRAAAEALRQNEERLRLLHDLTTARGLSLPEKADALLRMGCRIFGVDIGVVARVQEGAYRVTHAVSPGIVCSGYTCSADNTYCAEVLRTEQVHVIAHVGCSSWREMPAYAMFGLETYLGAPLWVGEKLYGTLCFSAATPHAEEFMASDREILRLMAQWLGTEMARAEAEDALRRAEEKFRLIYENATEGITQSSPQGRFLTANPAMARILGYDSPQQLMAEVTDIGSQLYADPAERARYASLLLGEGRAVAFEARLRRRDGNLIWASMNARAVRDDTGELLYFEGTVEDVTARREAAENLKDFAVVLQFQKAELEKANAELETLATTDGLTGLCNHRTFQQKLAENFQSARRYGPPLSLLLLDVDCFKQYNDTFGHPAGDAVLRQVSALLRDTTRATDVPARYGGEEFAVLLPHTDAAGAVIIAERVRAAIAGADWPLRPVTVSVGVCTLHNGVDGPAALVAAADAALYASKQGGRNRVTAAPVPDVPPSLFVALAV